MHTEIVLGNMTLCVDESVGGSGYVVTLFAGGCKRLALTLEEVNTLVNWVHQDYDFFVAPCHVSLIGLEAEPDEPGAGESPFAGEVPSWLSGPEPDESAGEMPSALSGIRRAPAEVDLAVWGEAIADALRKSDARGDAT